MKASVRQEEMLQTILEAVGGKLRQLRKDMGYASHADFASDHDLPRIQYWRIEKVKAQSEKPEAPLTPKRKEVVMASSPHFG